MARRNSTPKKKSGKETAVPKNLKAGPAATPQKGSRGGGFLKWFFVLVALLILQDIYSSWKDGKSFFSLSGSGKKFTVHQVARFTGTQLTGKPMTANGVAVVGPNEIAVVDMNAARVLMFDFNGKLIRQFGKYGSKGPYEFREPSSLITDHQGHIFVMDTWNGAIKGFDLNGKSIGTIDLNHFQSFYGPRNIAWGGKFILVLDVANYRVVKMSLDGQIDSVLSGKGTHPGQFMGIMGAAVDDANWYIADAGGNNRVEVFDNTGKVTRIIKVHSQPDCLALDGNNLFVGGWGNPSKVFTKDGKYLGQLEDDSQPGVALSDIYGIDIASNGLIVTCGGDQVSIYRVAEAPKN